MHGATIKKTCNFTSTPRVAIRATLPLPQKVHVSRSLMGQATKSCMVVPVYSMIIAVFPSTRVCVFAHIYRAERARWQCSLQVTPELWVLSRDLVLATLVAPGVWRWCVVFRKICALLITWYYQATTCIKIYRSQGSPNLAIYGLVLSDVTYTTGYVAVYWRLLIVFIN